MERQRTTVTLSPEASGSGLILITELAERPEGSQFCYGTPDTSGPDQFLIIISSTAIAARVRVAVGIQP